jgi:hypothetical protein
MLIFRFNILFFLIAFVSLSCDKKEADNDQPKNAPPVFETYQAGSLSTSMIHEASGIAPSYKYPDLYWVHNDSGDSAKIYLIDTAASVKATLVLTGCTNRDWEDISTFQDGEGRSFILIGDIGDNNKAFDYKYIYKLEEPEIPVGNNVRVKVDQYEQLTFSYPDGKKDAETLFIDPLTREIFIVSKFDPLSSVYSVPSDVSWNDTIILNKETSLDIFGVVGGDVNPEGNEIVIKSYDKIFYWKRTNGTTLADALKTEFQLIPYQQEPQGEAICFSLNSLDFLTITECVQGKSCRISYYKRKPK